MCAPVLAVAAVGATAASAAVGAYGQYQAGKAQQYSMMTQQSGYQAQADTARSNAAISEVNARTTEFMGELNRTTVLKVAGLNAFATEKIADLNAGITEHMADLAYGVSMKNAEIMQGAAGLNDQIAEYAAQDELRKGQRAEQISRLGTAQVSSQQRAALAANGVAVEADTSAVRLLASNEYLGEVEADTIHQNAVNAAFGIRSQALLDRAKVDADIVAYKAQAMGAQLQAKLTAGAARAQARWDAFTVRSNAEFDALNIGLKAQQDAINQRIQGQGFNAQATQATIAGLGINPKAVMPGLTAAGTLLGGLGQAAGMAYTFAQGGAFSGKK